MNINYIPQIPHSLNWAKGYSSNCNDFYNQVLSKKGPSLKNVEHMVTTINLKNGPPNTYIRFWAAKPGDHPYKSFKQAYSLNNKTEKMPNAKYENGGMVKTNNKGNCKFNIILPEGYLNKNGYLIPPHFHYRICKNNFMSPVSTHYFH